MGKKQFKYKSIASDYISDNFGSAMYVYIRQSNTQKDQYIVSIGSSGGRWFIFIPLHLWKPLKESTDRMIKELKLEKYLEDQRDE